MPRINNALSLRRYVSDKTDLQRDEFVELLRWRRGPGWSGFSLISALSQRIFCILRNDTNVEGVFSSKSDFGSLWQTTCISAFCTCQRNDWRLGWHTRGLATVYPEILAPITRAIKPRRQRKEWMTIVTEEPLDLHTHLSVSQISFFGNTYLLRSPVYSFLLLSTSEA